MSESYTKKSGQPRAHQTKEGALSSHQKTVVGDKHLVIWDDDGEVSLVIKHKNKLYRVAMSEVN